MLGSGVPQGEYPLSVSESIGTNYHSTDTVTTGGT